MQLVKGHAKAKNHFTGESLPIFLQVNDKETVCYVYSCLGFVKAGEDELLETVVDHNGDDPPYHWNEDHDNIRFQTMKLVGRIPMEAPYQKYYSYFSPNEAVPNGCNRHYFDESCCSGDKCNFRYDKTTK